MPFGMVIGEILYRDRSLFPMTNNFITAVVPQTHDFAMRVDSLIGVLLDMSLDEMNALRTIMSKSYVKSYRKS